jgi:hypothetical protein
VSSIAAPVSESVDVDAAAADVYALVSDLDSMASLAEETEEMTWAEGSSAQPGAVFRGSNRNGRKTWSTTCTVTDADPGRRFAFEVTAGRLPIARWQYDVEPLADADGRARCRVTESTWDKRPGWFKRPGGWLTGVADRDTASREHIRATLARLKARAEA